MLREWLAGLTELGLQAVSQARMLSAVKSFYGYLEQEGAALHQPAALLELPRLSRKLPTVLSINEVQEMIQRVDLSLPSGQRDRCILELMYACGLRVSEVVGLQRADLMLDLGLVRVRGKGNRERLVPLGSEATQSLRLYLRWADAEQRTARDGEGTVFLSRNGRPLTRMVVFLLVKKQAALCGLTKVVGPHAFRHAFATHMVEAGADLRAVQEMLGHRSILTTEIYTHLSRDYLREVVQRFHPLSGAARSKSR
jgi:integrase/recombinase XerD